MVRFVSRGHQSAAIAGEKFVLESCPTDSTMCCEKFLSSLKSALLYYMGTM